MRMLVTLLSAALLVAAFSVRATSTMSREVNATSIPETCLASNSAGTEFATYLCSQAVPHRMKGGLAKGRWNASQADLGWDYLEITQTPTLSASAPVDYHTGVLEGILTADRIAYWITPQNVSQATKTWINTHIAYMKTKAAAKSSPQGGFWNVVGAILQQIQGIQDGYNQVKGTNYSYYDFFILGFGPEIGDVQIAVDVQAGRLDKSKLLPAKLLGSHCSALIKPTHDDLFMAHDTWSGYGGMAHRIFKVYKSPGFEYTISFSSYPATPASGDDWYQISGPNNFGVQETTNPIFNTSLYVNVVPQSVSEFIRVMAANYLANGGEQWVNYFGTENSGTYNNQYMFVDFDKYVPGNSILPGTLWIAEQIPGFVQCGDESAVLASQGYWASYNIPYFPNIYELSGYTEMKKEQGSFWSYSKYARPEIFRRNNSDVKDIHTMMKMMRYNDYKEDPFSLIPNCTGATGGVCSPKHSSMLSVASRGDLMTSYNTTAENVAHYGDLFGSIVFNPGCFGAIDSKIASWKNRKTLNSWAISGPTNDQQPTFSYGGSSCPNTPAGSPTTFDFPWLEFKNQN